MKKVKNNPDKDRIFIEDQNTVYELDRKCMEKKEKLMKKEKKKKA